MSKLNRTGSVICPSNEELLLEYVKDGKLDKIEDLLIETPPLLVYEYPQYGTSIFPIACFEDGIKAETIEKLIKLGANLIGQPDSRPLHLAAQNPNISVLEVIIKYLYPVTKLQINQLDGKDNALLSLVKSIDVEDEGNFVKHVELLINRGIDVNETDGSDLSAIWWAAKKKFKQIVECILKKKGNEVDIDTHTRDGKSARDFILENALYNGTLPEKYDGGYSVKKQLFSLLKTGKEDTFIEKMSGNPDDSIESTYLQESCDRGLLRAVKYLVDLGADINLCTENNIQKPIEIAARNGYHEIFEFLSERPNLQIDSNKLLCDLLIKFDYLIYGQVDHEKCVEILLRKAGKLSLDVNKRDNSGNAPLHYALRYANEQTIDQLLKLGASLALKNDFGFMPIEDMRAHILQQHLDNNCLLVPNKNNCDKKESIVTFDYKTLLPTRPERQPMEEKDEGEKLVFETEVISYMSKCPELKPLLLHPVIVSFLIMKWHKIRWLFYANLTFYLIFLISLLTYVFGYYANFNGHKENFITDLAYFILILCFICLLFRELFQIAVSPRYYYKSFENYIEIALLITTCLIVTIKDPSEDTRRKLSAIVILLCAFELILMVGNHPKVTSIVVMFKTVSKNFIGLFLWYSLLIVAFALSFNILFKNTDVNSKNNTSDGSEKKDVFTGPGSSLFKTIIMLTGEFDASDLNFQSYPIISRLTFILFIFMITIILLNLLNGLAVSDTQAIKENAELVGHIARAQHMRYVENMLLGDIFPRTTIEIIKKLCCCLPWMESQQATFIKPLARRACLFVNNSSDKQLFFEQNTGRIYLESDEDKLTGNWNCRRKYGKLYADKEIIRRTNEIVKRRNGCSSNSEVDIKSVLNEYKEIKKQLDALLKIVSKQEN